MQKKTVYQAERTVERVCAISQDHRVKWQPYVLLIGQQRAAPPGREAISIYIYRRAAAIR